MRWFEEDAATLGRLLMDEHALIPRLSVAQVAGDFPVRLLQKDIGRDRVTVVMRLLSVMIKSLFFR